MVKEQAIRWAISAVSLLCLVAIGIYLAQFVWLLLGGVAKPTIQQQNQAATVSKDAYNFDLNEVQSWNLLGKPAKKAEIVQPVTAPKTTLKLELLGVFLGREGAASTAIIGEIGKDADSYKEGDRIAGGVTLKEVFADKVILNRNGRYETLAFAESTGGGAVAMPGSESQTFADARRDFLGRGSLKKSQSIENQREPAESQLGRMVQSGSAYSPASIMQALTQDLSQNPDAALSEMGLVAGADGNGYVISSNAPADLLQTMGLRVGDRVLSIDGQSMSGTSSDASLIQSAMQSSNVRVSVQRGTRTFTLNVPVPK